MTKPVAVNTVHIATALPVIGHILGIKYELQELQVNVYDTFWTSRLSDNKHVGGGLKCFLVGNDNVLLCNDKKVKNPASTSGSATKCDRLFFVSRFIPS